MSTLTTTYSFLMPLVGGDADVWGGMLNSNWADMDLRLTATFDVPSAGTLGKIKNTKLPVNLGSDKTVNGNVLPLFSVINPTAAAAGIKFSTTEGDRFLGMVTNTLVYASNSALTSGLIMEISSAEAWFAGVLTGDGSGLTDVEIDAGNITSGIIPNARLSATTYSNLTHMTGVGVLKFPFLRTDQGPDVNVSGDGDNNTGIRFPAGLPGVFFLTSDAEDIARINNDGFTVLGANKISGNGDGLTDLNASQLITGTVPVARLPDTAGGTSWVLGHVSDATHGDVGTYALLRQNSGSNSDPGDNKAGSTLTYANSGGAMSGGNPAGTWKCMGRTVTTGSSEERTTLWLRVS